MISAKPAPGVRVVRSGLYSEAGLAESIHRRGRSAQLNLCRGLPPTEEQQQLSRIAPQMYPLAAPASADLPVPGRLHGQRGGEPA